MSNAAANLRGDLAKFLGPAATAEWRALLAHLDFHRGFGLFVLLLPAKRGANLCESVLRLHLLAANRELAVVRPASPRHLAELPSELLEDRRFSSAGAVWVDLLGPSLLEDVAWDTATHQALAALNQHRNRLANDLAVPLIFVGEPWLQNALREAAPDLWTVRIAVVRLDDAVADTPHGDLLSRARAPQELMARPGHSAADPDYALQQARKLSSQPASHRERAELLRRAADGFYAQRRYELAAATAMECIQALATFPKETGLLAAANHVLAAARGKLGRRAEALAPAQEAVDLSRTLARQNPDAFGPDLAMSLNNLAAFLSEVGRRAEALASAQEAADLYRALARRNPDVFGPDLAMSLHNLANRLSEVGRRAEALVPAQEAVEIRRALARQNPDAFGPDLASSLNNLANRLSEVGRRAEALAPAQEAMEIRRALARQNPDALGPDLAMSLNNLAIQLSEVGRRAEALALAQEAVELYRALARQNPEALGPDLAMSLNNLANVLSEADRRAEALAPAQEALELRRALARQNPEAFGPNLALSLGMMGRTLEANERRDEALASFAEGIAVLTPLLQALPEAHAQLMQMLVADYLRLAQALGKTPDMALLSQVVAVFEQLSPHNETPAPSERGDTPPHA